MLLRSAPVAVGIAADGKTLGGFAVKYGDIAPRFGERIEPGAFERRASPLVLRLQHDPQRPIADSGGSLTVVDSAEGLRVSTPLREGSAELDLVRRGTLRGLSVEMEVRRERREGGLRVIEAADLLGVGLVDTPAYPTSAVELRQLPARPVEIPEVVPSLPPAIPGPVLPVRTKDAIANAVATKLAQDWQRRPVTPEPSGVAIRGMIPFGTTLGCECLGPDCDADQVNFADPAFDALGEAESREDVLLVLGNFRHPLGSIREGTLIVNKAAEGLFVEVENAPDTTAFRDLIAAQSAKPATIRPIWRPSLSEFAVRQGIAYVTAASVRGFVLGPTDTVGWPAAQLVPAAAVAAGAGPLAAGAATLAARNPELLDWLWQKVRDALDLGDAADVPALPPAADPVRGVLPWL
ncbi:MAG: HK97 family phage prohead protease [Acidimicrobiaceae bacterium]|nr:HK97 family phage prohead protease [Acidimicrobiaceae bacterium]